MLASQFINTSLDRNISFVPTDRLGQLEQLLGVSESESLPSATAPVLTGWVKNGNIQQGVNLIWIQV